MHNLDRLEATVRSLKRSVVFMFLLFLFLFACIVGQGVRMLNEPEELVIEDSLGRRRIHVGYVKDSPGVRLYDAAGEVRAGLALLGRDEPALMLSTHRGDGGAIIYVKDELATIQLRTNGKSYFKVP